MSLCNDTTTTMLVEPCNNNGNCNNGMWGGNWESWIILFLIWGLFGYGGNGFGGGYGGAGGQALTRGELCQDMNFQDVKNSVMDNGSQMQAGFRNIDNAICTLGYQNAQLINGVERQIGNEFRGVDNAICTLGYNVQQGFNNATIANLQAQNALSTQLANCCCETQQNIKDNTVQGVMNTNAIQQSIQNCCCENERIALDSKYTAAQQNCATLTAIDKLGDRIIDFMCAERTQNLRDENQALRLATSQQAQNNYLVQQLRPCPIPAYQVQNPFCCNNYASYGNC